MSSFLPPEFRDNKKDAMGSLEERESHITKIISFLSISTIGELIWVDRYLEKSFQTNVESNETKSNLFLEKIQQIEQLLKENQSMVSSIANIKQEKDFVQKHIETLEKNISELSSEKESLTTTIENIKQEKDGIKVERDLLAEELQRIGRLYEEATGKQASQEDLKEVLKLYITLMEEVFSGRAHFKILSVIHGEKEVWTREELVKSTGFAEIKLRSVLGDLVRANLIEYDEEQATVKLLHRISSLS